jgi:hypothetical protein
VKTSNPWLNKRKLFFVAAIFGVIFLAAGGGSAFAKDGSVSRKKLEEKFDRITHFSPQRQPLAYFKLSESLELDPDLRGLKGQRDDNKVYFLDYVGLLKKLSPEQQIMALRFALKRKDAKYRGPYAFYLAQTKDPESFKDILRLKPTKDEGYAVRALQYYDTPQSISSLIDSLLNDELPEIRYIAAACLGGLGNKMSIPFLIQALDDHAAVNFPSPSRVPDTVADSALNALNKIGEKTWTVEAWKHATWDVALRE